MKVLLVMCGLLVAGAAIDRAEAASFILSGVKVRCISQADATGSDQVYVTIANPSVHHKVSRTRALTAGVTQSYTEIGPNNGSAVTAWFIQPGDRITVMEKDLLDPDDQVIRVTLTQTMCNGQLQRITGTNGSGRYEITFKVLVI